MNRPMNRWSAFLLPLLAVTAGLSWAALRKEQAAPALQVTTPQLSCSGSPHFTPGYTPEAGSIRTTGNDAFLMLGESWLQADFCSPANVVLDVQGQQGGGKWPIMTALLNDQLIGEYTIKERSTLRLPITKKGRLILGYFNDYYRSEARQVILEAFQERPACNLNIVVPPATGGVYNAQMNTAGLVSDVPMTVTPCQAGTLSFQVIGVPGAGQFPILELKQNNQVIRSVQTKSVRQRIEIPVQASPLTIRLTNPYFKELDDRNLIIHGIQVNP